MFVLGLALSLAIGLSLGLLGGGGSILTVPVLHYVFGTNAHDAIATSLLIVGATSAFTLVPHVRAGCIRWRTGLVFGAASMGAAFAGGRLGATLPGGILMPAFAVVMVAAGAAMILRSRSALSSCRREDTRTGQVLAIGLGVGLVTGVLGAGGGFIIVPALTLVGGMAIREAVATSLLVIVLNSGAGLAGSATSATLDPSIVVPVLAVASLGSIVGLHVGRRLTPTQLSRAFGWFVLGLGLLLLATELR